MMTKFQIVKVFLSYFVLYALIGVLSAWIPFFYLSVMLGSFSITLAALTLATIRTIEFKQMPLQSIGVKKFVIAMLILIAIDLIYSVFAVYAGSYC
jgi:hypothetical protein